MAGFIERMMENLARWLLGHHRLALLVLLLATLAAVPGFNRLDVRNDYAEMLPENAESVKALDRLKERVPGLADHVVLFEGGTMSDRVAAAEKLLQGVVKDPFVLKARYKTELAFFEPYKFLYMPADELDEFSRAVIGRINYDRLKESGRLVDLLSEDEKSEDLDAIRKKHEVDDYFGYFTDKDRSVLLLLITPRAFVSDVDAAEKISDITGRAIAAVFPGGDPGAGIRITTGGPFQDQLNEDRVLREDIIRGSTFTLIVIVALLLVYYRSFWPVLLITGPLNVSMMWSFGIAGWFVGRLNPMSGFMGMILFGLGIDYAIHLMNRYIEHRSAGLSREESFINMMKNSGAACVETATTNCGIFFVVATADFRGYQQFGVLAGIGAFMTVIASVVLLPCLFLELEARGWNRFLQTPPPELQRRFAGSGGKFPWAGPILVATAGFTAWSFYQSSENLHFSFRISELRPSTADLRKVEKYYREVGEIDDPPVIYTVDSLEDVKSIVRQIEKVNSEQPASMVLKTRSVLTVLPEDQEEKLDILDNLRFKLERERRLADTDSQRADIDKLLGELTGRAVTMEDIPPEVAADFRTPDGGFLVYLNPYSKNFEQGFVLKFREFFSAIGLPDGRTYTGAGEIPVEADILYYMVHEGPQIVLLAVCFVVFFVWLGIGRGIDTLLVCSPMVVGILWGLEGAVWLGQSINVFNLVAIPLLIGFGEDYGLHILHRYREEGPGSLRKVLGLTGASIAMSALTTLAGFGGLIFSHHKGLQSLGIFACVGMGASLLVAFTFVPAILQVIEDRQNRKSG